jgi:hypothetical protein
MGVIASDEQFSVGQGPDQVTDFIDLGVEGARRSPRCSQLMGVPHPGS